MPEYLHPGVYVEEIPSGSKPIEGVGTSTAAFVGYATKGPIGEPTLISKWDDYDNEFGGIRNLQKETMGDPMGLSVAAFYQNGGTKAYIVRITEDWMRKNTAIPHAEKAVGYMDNPSDSKNKAIKFTAVNDGEWANGIIIKMELSSISTKEEILYDVDIGRNNKKDEFSRIESFTDVSLDETHPMFIKNVIDGVSELVTVDLVEDVSSISMISDNYLGSTTSADLDGVPLDFSTLSVTERKLKITIDAGPEDTITLPKKDYSTLDEVASAIQAEVRKISAVPADAPNDHHTEFTCKNVDNRLILTSGTRKALSSVVVNSTFGIAGTLKLGIDSATSFIATSTSGDLAGVPLDFSGITDESLRTLSGSIDGAPFTPLDLGATNFATLGDVATKINEISGLSCMADGNRLVLTSDTHTFTSSVVIDSDSGIALTLKLGVTPTNRGGAEVTGQHYYDAILSLGTSTSCDLSGLTLPLSLSDTTAFPDADSRTLMGSVDGVDFTPLVLPATDLADLNAIAAAIDGISGLSSSAVENQLVLKSDTNTATSAVVITSDFGIAPTLKLGVTPTNYGGAEITGQQSHDVNLRAEVNGQQSANVAFPKDTLDGGTDGGEPGEDDYDEVFTKFIKYRDINIICLPGQHWSADSSGNPIIQKAIGHAEKMKSRMVIVDPPSTHELDNPKKVNDMGLPSQTYCVVYYPWVEAANRFYHAERFPGLPKKVLVPPSGYAAGMWAKIDGKRGVWKAPAGTETGLLGLAGLQYKVEDDEQDSLNPWGVNCLRSMPGSGKVIWGARTRATKADPEWRYVPVRRTAIMIEQSIYNGIQWAVFEPNDHRLWSALRGNIGGFMNSLFRVGAFQGEKASDAYFVRCGLGDTMTQTDIDAGQVIVIVGFAPLKPAEFVIVRIQQKVNQQ